ncbi:MAG: hypothetical protein ABR607_14675 [Pyrinomonadaceae bacterium]
MRTRSFLILAIIVMLWATVPASVSDEKRIELNAPAAPWVLSFPAANFKMAERKIRPDGAAYFYLTDENSGLNVSMYIEPVKDCNSSKACRDMIWKAGNPNWVNPQNVVQGEIRDVSYVEFMVPEFQRQPVRQENMYAEFVVDRFWVDLHISKVLFTPADHSLFEEFVKSIKFESKKRPV